MNDIEAWIKSMLWTRWGWQGWMEDDCDLAYRDAGEKRRIESAVTFVLRALGNNESPETAAVVEQIVARSKEVRQTPVPR